MAQKHLHRRAILAAAPLLALASLACGGGGDTDSTPASTSTQSSIQTSAASSPTPTAVTAAVSPTEAAPTKVVPGGGNIGTPPPVSRGAPDFSAPPSTTASANGASVETGIGTYCWGGLCVDKIGVPTLGELTLSNGDTVTIALPQGTPPLIEASATTFAAVDFAPLDDGSTIWLYPAAIGDPIQAQIADDGILITVELPPGQYVLATSVFFNPGDILYGVLLNVQ